MGETEAPGTTQKRSHIPITHQLGSGGDTQASPEDQAGPPGWQRCPGSRAGFAKGAGARVATAAAQAGADAAAPAEPRHEQNLERG